MVELLIGFLAYNFAPSHYFVMSRWGHRLASGGTVVGLARTYAGERERERYKEPSTSSFFSIFVCMTGGGATRFLIGRHSLGRWRGRRRDSNMADVWKRLRLLVSACLSRLRRNTSAFFQRASLTLDRLAFMPISTRYPILFDPGKGLRKRVTNENLRRAQKSPIVYIDF